MQYRQIYRDISIVAVGSVNRDVCNPLNLFKHKIIDQGEMESINDKDMRVGSDIVSFRAKSFELYCDSNRMQVRTLDYTKSEQLSDLILNVLRMSETIPNAIGINASFRFCMDERSFLDFCNKCAPMTAFSPMADNAVMIDLTFLDWNQTSNDGQPMAVYNIKRLTDGPNNQKVVQIIVNNHLDMKNGMNTVTHYLAAAGQIHSQFFEKCQHFLNCI